MTFFTPDLLERFGSASDGTAFAAGEELERRSEDYLRKLREIELKLPQRLRELLDQFYLHDAQILTYSSSGVPDVGWAEYGKLAELGRERKPHAGEEARLLSFWIPLQLDAPPGEVLILQYRSVLIEEVLLHESLREDDLPCREWLYDEVDLIPTVEGDEFRHSILFTQGLELRLRFQDFDFAALRPIGIPQQLLVCRK
jgi:hypothetical protein